MLPELEPLLDLVDRLSDVVNDLADEPLTLRVNLSRWDVGVPPFAL